MITPRVEGDDSESDDQGPMCKTPLNTKALWQTEENAFSDNTEMTSPCSSTEEPSSVGSRDFTISFSDKHHVIEVDCDYTDEQVSRLWFTKEEYDDFLQACDEDAQKSEAYEKETRVNKLKKEIKRQRRQRQKEEKRHRTRVDHGLDESMNSLAGQDEYTDASDDDELDGPAFDFDEDQDGWLCSLGLEAWTLEGYKARELHRQKAIDSVLNEQYAAWDRGMLENAEMMSTLYFAASAITKHEAHKKAIELEKDIQELTVVSTLEDYNRTVQDLNVLQKSLQCIQKQREKKEGKQELPPLAKRRRSTGDAAPSSAPTVRRGSTGGMGKASPKGVIEHSTAISDSPVDRAPKQPIKSISPYPPQSSSSNASRKFKQRNSTQKVYKSKASTDILVALPTPPVTKKKSVASKATKGGWPGVNMPLTDDSEELTTPKYRKIIYKPIVGDTPKHDSASRSKASDIITTSTTTTTAKKKKKKKKKKDSSSKSKKDHSERSKRSTRRARSESPKKTSTKESSTTGKLLKKTSPTMRTPKGTTKKVRSVSASPQRNSTKEHWWFQQQREALLLKQL